MDILVYIFLVFFFLFLEGFFSGSEIATISYNRLYIQHLANTKNRSAILVEELTKDVEEVFSTTSFGTNLSVVCSSATLTALFVSVLGVEKMGDLFAAALLIPMTLLFGEIIPKMYFQQYAEKAMLVVVYPLRFFQRIFSPFIAFCSYAPKLLLSMLPKGEAPDYGRDALQNVIVHSEGSELGLENDEREMINNIISLHEIRVREIMVPLVNMVALNSQTTDVRAALKTGQKSNFSRLPVFKEKIHNIVGIVNCLELIHEKELTQPIKSFVKPVYFVPEIKRVDELLLELLSKGIHVAFAVDEHGGCTGLITAEDILEEIVGEIVDEHDNEETSLHQSLGDGVFLVDASMEIEEANRVLPVDLPIEGEYETVAGYLLERFGKIPERGECYEGESARFEVTDADDKKIYKVRISHMISEKVEGAIAKEKPAEPIENRNANTPEKRECAKTPPPEAE